MAIGSNKMYTFKNPFERPFWKRIIYCSMSSERKDITIFIFLITIISHDLTTFQYEKNAIYALKWPLIQTKCTPLKSAFKDLSGKVLFIVLCQVNKKIKSF